jgi:hypothetical protein
MMERDRRAERSQEELELQHSTRSPLPARKSRSARLQEGSLATVQREKERIGPDDEHVIFGQLPPHAAAQLHGAAMALAFQRGNVEVRNEATLPMRRTLF